MVRVMPSSWLSEFLEVRYKKEEVSNRALVLHITVPKSSPLNGTASHKAKEMLGLLAILAVYA